MKILEFSFIVFGIFPLVHSKSLKKPLQNDLRSVFVIEKSCNVIELASELSKPCEGTFIYENKTYYGCTKIGDSKGRAWCSTKIDPLTYEHVSDGNFYGFCPEDGSCSTAEEGQEIQNRVIDLESSSLYSTYNMDLSECACQSWESCAWSVKAINLISGLPQTHASYRSLSKFYLDRKCDAGGKKVYCCKNGKHPKLVQIKEIKKVKLRDDDIDWDSLKVKDVTKNSCKCQNYASCNWSIKLVNTVSGIEKSSPAWTSHKLFLQDKICDTEKQNVYCCGQNGTYPTSDELLELNGGSTGERDKDSSRWKPDETNNECGVRSIPAHIRAGQTTKPGEFPYMALLGYNSSSKGFNKSLTDKEVYYECGGSLINKWYVLTAAHCMDNFNPIEIVFGEHTVGTDPDCINGGLCSAKKITRKPDKIIIHEDYLYYGNTDGFYNLNDIALIRLNESVPLYSEDPEKSSVIPICLPWQENNSARNLNDDTNVIMTGWGLTQDKKLDEKNFKEFGVRSQVLKRTKLPIASNKCTATEGEFLINPQLQYCAGGKTGKDSCLGDSGGPLVFREKSSEPWYQVGIVSYGTQICGIGEPGVYTKVEAYLSWIESKIKI